MDRRVGHTAERRPPPVESSPGASGAAFAAVDLGTNNCRLLVARPEEGRFRVVDAFSRNVRLGEGLEKTGRLSDVAMRRAVDALQVCADKIRRARPQRVRVIATEACRRARNGAAFLDRARRETGLDIELITPEQEARLAVAGCAPLVDHEAEHLMVFDIGGGSTELIWVDLTGAAPEGRERLVMALAHGALDGGDLGREARSRIVDWVSAPLGVASLHDKFLDVVDDRSRYALMSWFFEEHLAAFAPYLEEDPATIQKLQLIGTSGTVTTMAAAYLGLAKYDRSRVDGIWLPTDATARLVDMMIDLGPRGRHNHPSIGRDRAQLIISGAAILQTILRIWPVTRLRVADRGLREGILYGLMNGDAGGA